MRGGGNFNSLVQIDNAIIFNAQLLLSDQKMSTGCEIPAAANLKVKDFYDKLIPTLCARGSHTSNDP